MSLEVEKYLGRRGGRERDEDKIDGGTFKKK